MAWKITVLLAAIALAGCSGLERGNPLDPKSPDFMSQEELRQALIGSWSLETQTENWVYTFNIDDTVQLDDYSSPQGGPVDRDASYPQLLVVRYSGGYRLRANQLDITFSTVQVMNTTEVAEPSLPPSRRTAVISIRSDVLTMTESTGERIFTRL